MKKLLGVGLLLALFGALPVHADSTRVVEGGVFGDWTKAHSPYVILGDVTVPAGQTLAIGMGVTVYFAGHYTLTVEGKLQRRRQKSTPPETAAQ